MRVSSAQEGGGEPPIARATGRVLFRPIVSLRTLPSMLASEFFIFSNIVYSGDRYGYPYKNRYGIRVVVLVS